MDELHNWLKLRWWQKALSIFALSMCFAIGKKIADWLISLL